MAGTVPARAGFAHTVLVDMRERLRRSQRPDRIFDVALTAAREAGLLTAADTGLARRLRAALASGDDYATAGKPVIDWDDKAAREALVDSRARDGYALLTVLDGAKGLPEPVGQAMRLLATVLGQDLETDPDGVLRIARKVAPDRVISTVDPQARHGHKTSHRGFDGYKGHIALDPDSELITATAVTPGNTGDAQAAPHLIADLTTNPADPARGGRDPRRPGPSRHRRQDQGPAAGRARREVHQTEARLVVASVTMQN
ncbi:transposase [Dactylosporangium sp. NPDC000555]|uniref:transposase n=1 Tax=Dactylosporangium sp. NPDC000555 TaxID=3154260 RepID=UPI003330FD8A